MESDHSSNANPESKDSSVRKEGVNKSTLGLKGLKQTQDYIDQVKRRLSLLQVQQEKNKKRMDENYRKLKFIARVQEEATRDHVKRIKYYQKMKEDLELTKIHNQMKKSQNREYVKSAKSQILQFNKKKSEETKIERKDHEKDIVQLKKQEQDKKIQKRKQINEMERKQRQKLQMYFQQRKQSFKKKDESQGKLFTSLKSQRDLLLNDLTSLQMEMIARQSSSRVNLEKSAQLLKSRTSRSQVSSAQSATKDNSHERQQKIIP